MTLDCARPLLGGVGIPNRPGTLYVPLGTGQVASVIVDSRRLDPTAEWPKYQRDAYNSGNALGYPDGGMLNCSVPRLSRHERSRQLGVLSVMSMVQAA